MDDNIILLIKRLNIALEQYERDNLKQFDISPSQCFMLNYLFVHAKSS